ncbi:TBP-interacting_protein TIP49 [Hexamita inflata]|uniref:RuvB-like helicase n=1 Tax=Hexamita inflata TaxID=28002 RepID=A0AA86VA07_9EUKA|nr:TBP-interacting protein TIP49 [Hexamita inflata]CAI9968157.1 TBP-interacting protein TIP49 [Hexamita inflata]
MSTDLKVNQLSRVGAHSHVRGLGLNDELRAEGREGLIGQPKARRAAGVIQKLIENGKLGGRALLIAGPPGSGKTALAMALAQSLNQPKSKDAKEKSTPFVNVSAAEFFSLEINPTEAITQAIRRSISVTIPEETELIEGEVAHIAISESQQGEKSGKVVLKTTDMEAQYDIGPKMIEMLNKESIVVGDIISIDKLTGRLTKLGRSMQTAQDLQILGVQTKLLPPPSGELQKRRQVEHVVTLHDMDVINSRSQGFLALFSGETGEISQEVREQVDGKIALWKEENRCQINSGVLFIDECHILTMEAFSFLNRVLESEISPVIIFATNRGITKIRGTEYTSPFGIPMDLLDRMLIISTEQLDLNDFQNILKLRCEEEDVEFEQKALQFLAKIAEQTSMRYAMQLITVSNVIAKRQKRNTVHMDDIKKAHDLFLDVGRSVDILDKIGGEYMFHDGADFEKPKKETHAKAASKAKVEVNENKVRIDEDE